MVSKKLILFCLFFIVSCDENSSSDELVSVYINTGETQCGGDGLTLEETSSYLINDDININESQCGFTTGLDFPTVCGAGTSNIYIHTILSSDLTKAENLGFTALSNLDPELGYETVECS